MNTRQISILKDLISTNQYKTSRTVAEQYNVSTKTIYSDLAVINDKLSSFHMSIEKRPRRGIRLKINQKERQELVDFLEKNHGELFDEMSQFQRECALLRNLILETGEVDILEWSATHFISEASIRRDLDKLEKQFFDYKLVLTRKSGKVALRGEEKNIRSFFRNFVIQNFILNTTHFFNESVNIFFESEKVNEVLESVRHLSNAYHFKTSEQYSVYLVLDILINTIRYLQGNIIVENSSSIEVANLEQYEVYVIAGELLSRNTGIAMSLIPDSEIKHICYTLLSVGYEAQIVNQSDVEEAVTTFIKRVSDLSSVDFTGDTHLFRMLVNHVQPMIYRLKSDINIKNQTTEEIKTKYSVLYHIVWLASKTLSDKYEVELFDAEIAFLTIYFEISVEKLTEPLTIYVICPHGLATSELIMSSLKRTISDFDHLINIDLKELDENKIEQADLIISSIHLDNVSRDFIRVSPIVTDAELETIQHAYAELSKGNRNMLSVIHDDTVFSKSVITELLQSNILLEQHCQSVEECIKLMVDKTSLDNQSNPMFQQSILLREQLGSTSMYTGIALPHADPMVVSKSQLVMMTLDKPMKWGRNLIKVVVLIAIAEKDEQLYKKALISLYSKIDNKDYIDSLSGADTIDVFISRL